MSISTKIKNWIAALPDQWRATLRTFVQSLVGGVLFMLLTLLGTATDFFNGEAVNWAEEVSNAGRALMIVVVSACIGLVTFLQNRFGAAAHYDDPAA